MAVVRFYSNEALKSRALQRAAKLYPHLLVTTELCYNVELTGECVTGLEDANYYGCGRMRIKVTEFTLKVSY